MLSPLHKYLKKKSVSQPHHHKEEKGELLFGNSYLHLICIISTIIGCTTIPTCLIINPFLPLIYYWPYKLNKQKFKTRDPS